MGRHPGGGDDNYAPPPPAWAAAAASSDSEPAIPFGSGGQGAVATSVGYTNLAFAVFTRGCFLLLLGSSSSSLSTGAVTDEDTAALGVAQYFLGTYGGGRGGKGEGGKSSSDSSSDSNSG